MKLAEFDQNQAFGIPEPGCLPEPHGAGSTRCHGSVLIPCSPSLIRQRGQVMPIAAIFAIAVLLALWLLNDAAEAIIQKQQLQNTADSTAYSVGTLMARNWNYAAYMNRAMVANQAAIGQGVGFAAWNKGCIRYAVWCTPLALIDFAQIDFYLKNNDQTLNKLSDAQNQFNQGAAQAEAQLSSDVTLANDPDVTQVTYLDYQPAPGQASVPTSQWSVPAVGQLLAANGVRFTQFQNVVIGSQDHFTANRSFQWPNYLLIFREVEYGGDEFMLGTQNGRYKWEWTALDTLSTYPFGVENRVAYAAARAPIAGAPPFNYSAYKNNTTMWGMGAWKNPKAAQAAANADSNFNIYTVSGQGLRPFLDVANDGQSDDGDTVLVLMKKPDSQIWLQKNWNKLDPSFQVSQQLNTEQDGGLPSNQVTTLAKAQIYFYRPYETKSHVVDWNRQNLPSWITGDSEYAAAYKNQAYRYEHGSLYSPFWDVHLVDTTNAERQLAQQYAGVG